MLFKQIVSLLKLNKLTEFEKDKKELVIFSKYSIHFLLLAIIFIIYTFFTNLIISYNDKKINNFNELVNSNEFENVSNAINVINNNFALIMFLHCERL